MAQNIKVEQLTKEIKGPRKDIKHLLGFLYEILGKDEEGVYRPEFVKEILKAAKEKPQYKFTSPKEFLKLLNEEK
ncbi:MAG: hypothetical protein LR000_01320 [Candidatus Pacebacteria bacterium]|nr:hypothetical protein [Candidatus Paceibacterota bacterium]